MAAALVAVDALLSAVGLELPALSLAALVLAPGLALAALLPEPLRRSWTALVASLPGLGFAVISVTVISAASAGAPLEPWLVRLLLAAVAAVGLALPAFELPSRPGRAELAAGLGLVAALALGLLLQERVIGGYPLPGNDWAKYVLYADEIRAHGSLLIDNPFWMLGVPFREDPGVPALYGVYLVLGGQSAASLAHGIGLFFVAQILSVFALVRAFWGRGPAVAAAALWAALPLNLTILGWHGLANVAAFPLMTLLLAYAACLIRGELRDLAAVGAGVTVVALAATHRLSLVVGLATLAVSVAAALLLATDRRAVVRGVLVAATAGIVVSPGVVYDLVTRARTFGGTLSSRAYLSSKIDLGLLIRDLTIPFVAAVAIAALFAFSRSRRDRALVPLLCMLVVVAGMAVSWLVEFPLSYTRMAYYLPLSLVPLAAIAIWRLPRGRWLAPAAAGVLTAYLAAVSFSQADDVNRFYSFANPGSVRGLDAVSAQLRPREVVVTDRCWSFLATWLLHTRTLPALDPADIQPKAELPRARQAHAVLSGSPEGRALVRRLHVRFLLVDPGCSSANGQPTKPPRLGRPVFVSRRLVILRLG